MKEAYQKAESLGRPIVKRAMAVRQGLEEYFTGKPCENGHISARKTVGYYCTDCYSSHDEFKKSQAQKSYTKIKEKRIALGPAKKADLLKRIIELENYVKELSAKLDKVALAQLGIVEPEPDWSVQGFIALSESLETSPKIMGIIYNLSKMLGGAEEAIFHRAEAIWQAPTDGHHMAIRFHLSTAEGEDLDLIWSGQPYKFVRN